MSTDPNPSSANSFWRECSWGVRCVFMLLACFMAYLVWDQKHWWSLNPDYSFGYIVPVFVLYIIYDRWGLITSLYRGEAQARDSWQFVESSWMRGISYSLFLLATLLGLFFLGFGGLIRMSQGVSQVASLAMALGFAGMTLGLVYIVSDTDTQKCPLPARSRWHLVLLFVFPALIWLLSAPLLDAVERRLSLFLMGKVTEVVFGFFNALAMPIEQVGNTLRFPNGDQVMVAEACSGIRSLTGCLFSGSFLSAVFLNKLWKKVSLVLSALMLAFITNIFRSLLLTYLAYERGSEYLNAEIWGTSIHDFTGYAVLGLTSLGLICLLPVFNFKQIIVDRYGDRLASKKTSAA